MHKQNKTPNSVVTREVSAALYSGPIPDPIYLEKYEHICPGAADRIIKMAEKQAEHRQMLESMALKSNTRNSAFGVVFAFILGVITILCGATLAYFGRELSGTLLGSAGLIGLVGVFIYGTRSNQKERASKKENKKID